MAVTLNKIIPWGRSFDEYVAMFNLSDKDLEKQFLDCGSGPASFNASLTRLGGRIISVDPIYRFGSDEIRNQINEAYEIVLGQLKDNTDDYLWDQYPSVEEHCRVRMRSMNEFLSDYNDGIKEGRYVEASLPALPFRDDEFDIALCSYLLFAYSKQLSEEFHVRSIKELCRVSSEVRIFPVMEIGIKSSRYLGAVIDRLSKEGYEAVKEKVKFEFQKGSTEMLRVTAL